jgi:hypothetical protein
MKKYLILSLLFVAMCRLSAQNTVSSVFGNKQLEQQFLYETFNGVPMSNADNGIRGMRYSTEDYVAGELVMKNGNRYSNQLKLKFDEYANAIQIKFDNGKESVLFYNNVDSCKLFVGNKVIQYIKADVPTESETNKFYQVIYASANYQLIKLPKKTVVNVDNRDVFGEGEQFKKFESKNVYFFKKGKDKPFEKIKISKKALLELLPNKKENINKLFETSAFKGLLDDAKLAALFTAIDF